MSGDRLAHARAVAASVPDPEIPALTIAELGMLRDVAFEGDTVVATITPSYSGCPATLPIARDVVVALHAAGFSDARVRTVLAPAWSSDWITPEGRRKLAASGIAPPPDVATQNGTGGGWLGRAAPRCPRCGSADTELISGFGATPCKSLHRCRACREPFEAFKCH